MGGLCRSASLWPLGIVGPAQGFLSGGSYGLGFYNYGAQASNPQLLPFYALYPPVYYSYPVARPYGYSPFAYPPGTLTPDVAPRPAAAMYQNPYVPRRTPTESTTDQTASVAKMYYNPFVTRNRMAASKPAPRDAN